MTSKKTDDYKHIRAWGKMLHSNREYVWGEVQKARADKAPDDAIYWSVDDKRWHTFAEVTSSETRRIINQILSTPEFTR